MEECERYIQKYPYDSSIITTYVAILINIGDIERAETVLNGFVVTKNTREETIAYYYDSVMKLLGCRRKFDECYSLFMEHKDLLKNYMEDYYFRYIYLQKKLGLEISVDLDEKLYSYLTRQTISYDEQHALNHIEKHFDLKNLSEDNSIFLEHIDVKNIFSMIRSMLPCDDYPAMYTGIFKNLYIFKYDNCGVLAGSNKHVDYFRVITLQDSNQILAMYPTDNPGKYPSIDITPKVDYEKEKVKRISQIDKFNQRYGKMIDKK